MPRLWKRTEMRTLSDTRGKYFGVFLYLDYFAILRKETWLRIYFPSIYHSNERSIQHALIELLNGFQERYTVFTIIYNLY